ncbi:MarR family winged helix-turn-helix transcriptional regulator [Rhizobium oryziradicis]|uniref:MarR family transcriptional regulator n=1 Tax=Rhizobium oryziradicis TaxID=1867956 RepID=A0A1Q8ZWA6_9HYPH|nr:MarR family transcriptional regulator [Rhizobium oryziradicis]OLP46267.1 MarR family transcriptional regulator [Rhizobium oryziradicis]
MEPKSDFQRALTSQLFTAARLWRKLVDQALIEHGISEACAAPLLWISRLGDGVRQTALAEHIGIESPSLVRLLDQLEALDMVVRKDDPLDRRAKGLWLTPAGVELAARIEAVLDRERARVLGDISETELEMAFRVLDVFQQRCGDALQGGGKKEGGQ